MLNRTKSYFLIHVPSISVVVIVEHMMLLVLMMVIPHHLFARFRLGCNRIHLVLLGVVMFRLLLLLGGIESFLLDSLPHRAQVEPFRFVVQF